ncbi:hypothetical protein E2P81_ATG03061 [Venturia nashicola]|uniref:BTB domain-containing protein n=1 Tax=Venturia nashicola TaxID=86259 RepID=A0A4Z1PJD2_9PEZI|nr:hypothetical protein E6O75_ATG03126 [Venturia nashicola]TLD36172.1 hypothetical protein E2P81_ATG03061 [Venturia nashicola]
MNCCSCDIILNNANVEPNNQFSAPINPASTANEAIFLCYTSKQYTDLILICKSNVSIPVHKIIICPQCSFISNALKKPWAKTKPHPDHEAKEISYIDFSDDPTQAINQMIEFFYKGTYTSPPTDPSKSSTPTFHHGIDRIRQHVQVYIVATKYLIPTLAAKALQQITDLQHDYPKSMEQSPALVDLIRYLYENTSVSEGRGNEVGKIIAKVTARYAKYILETPGEGGTNVFFLGWEQGVPMTQTLIDEFVDAIAEKDETLAVVMLDYLEDFGKEVIKFLCHSWGKSGVEGEGGPNTQTYLYSYRWAPDQAEIWEREDTLPHMRELHAAFGPVHGQFVTL